jgi:hypothetical protein
MWSTSTPVSLGRHSHPRINADGPSSCCPARWSKEEAPRRALLRPHSWIESVGVRPAHLRVSADHTGSAWAMGVGVPVNTWNDRCD